MERRSRLRTMLFRGSRAVFALSASFVVASAVIAPSPAHAAIVERIVAVVGERPVLLSELRHRARPHLGRIAMTAQSPAQAAAAENELFRELLTRMIEEQLELMAADKARIVVSEEEVDNGIRQVAAQAGIPPKSVIAEARKQGLSEQDYKAEIRRQVLEGKLLNLRVRNRVRVTEQDARAAYERQMRELAAQSPVDLRILVLNVAPGATERDIEVRKTLGEELARRARAGEDFCQLVLEYSEEPSLKTTCGTRGPIPLASLPPELQRIATTVKAGQVADPVVFRDPNGSQAVLVVQVAADQPKLPPFAEVKEQMMERAFYDAMERQKKEWLKELRRGVYIDVRL